mgnify:CR=1 FL=1
MYIDSLAIETRWLLTKTNDDEHTWSILYNGDALISTKQTMSNVHEFSANRDESISNKNKQCRTYIIDSLPMETHWFLTTNDCECTSILYQ